MNTGTITRFSAAVAVVVLIIGALMIFTTMMGSVLWQKNKRERDFRHLAETVEKFHRDLCAPALLMHTKLQVLLTRQDLQLSREAEEVVRFAYERSREIQALAKERLPPQGRS